MTAQTSVNTISKQVSKITNNNILYYLNTHGKSENM